MRQRNRDSFTFEIKLESRTLAGELHRLDTFHHPGCESGAVDAGLRLAMSACTGRIEAAYVGAHDGIRVSQQALTFSDSGSATHALHTETVGVFRWGGPSN